MQLVKGHNEVGAERHRLLRKLEGLAPLTAEERQAVLDLPMLVRRYTRGQDIHRDGDRLQECCLLLEGFTSHYKLLPDGRRQITAFHVPGDMPDLQSLHVPTMEHSIAAMMPTRVAFIPHRSLHDLTDHYPGLLHALWRDTLIHGAIARAWMTGIGRRSALERMAHLLCEMLVRFEAVGLALNRSFRLPVGQVELGDTLGLSAVHVNRVLQDMRRSKLITWTGTLVTVLAWEKLQAIGCFDAAYLHQDHAGPNEPRRAA